MQKLKKRSLLIVACMLLVLVCVGSGWAKPKELVIMTRVGPENDAIKAVIPEYEKKTGINIKVDETGVQGYSDRQTTMLMAGGNLDVVMYTSDYGATFAAAKLLVPLNKFINRYKSKDADIHDFFASTLNAFTYKDVIYGLPTDISTWMLNYNTKFVKTPPTTYDEYLETAKKFTKRYNPDSPTEYGTNVRGKRGSESPLDEWMQILWAMGGDLFDNKFKPIFNNDIGVKALTFQSDLFLKWHVVPEDVAALDAAGVIEAFKQEKTALLEHWNSDTVIFENPKESPKIANNVRVALLPGVKQANGKIKRAPLVQGWAVGIAASSKNVPEAFKFIQWLTGKSAGQKYFLAGGTPARKSVLSLSSNAKFRPELPVLAETLEMGRAKPVIKEWAQISSILQLAHAEVFVGAKKPKQALDEAAKQVYELLDKAGYYK
jgi:multiple sugar transport system substrate-binding protein